MDIVEATQDQNSFSSEVVGYSFADNQAIRAIPREQTCIPELERIESERKHKEHQMDLAKQIGLSAMDFAELIKGKVLNFTGRLFSSEHNRWFATDNTLYRFCEITIGGLP